MIPLKTKITTRKFYNKWFYKVSLEMPGSGIFNILSPDDIFSNYSSDSFVLNNSFISQQVLSNKTNIVNISKFLSEKKCEWAKRIESRQLDIYTNDKDMYNEICEQFGHIVYYRCEPNPDTLDLYTDEQSTVVKKFPHNRYQFKVYLWPHKAPADIEERQRFLDWIDDQNSKIRISEAVKVWFLNTRYNWDRRYILVEDSQTLLMLKLKKAEVIGRIYKYVIHDK